MSEIRVSSWNELNEQLYQDAWKESLRRFRSDYAFRGMSHAGYGLETSLMRLGDGYEQVEEPLLRTFQRYAHRHAAEVDTIWNWLALAQHHGLPTRLLDWTFSPYVAMHFATEQLDAFDEDGAIWCVDYVRARAFLPGPLHAILEGATANVFTAEMVQQGAESLHALQALSEEPFVLFFEPPSLDERIINQYALFGLMSDPRVDMVAWLRQHPELYRCIIVPASLKWEVRDKLDQANITERVLYPGLDGLSRWLKRYYTPRR